MFPVRRLPGSVYLTSTIRCAPSSDTLNSRPLNLTLREGGAAQPATYWNRSNALGCFKERPTRHQGRTAYSHGNDTRTGSPAGLKVTVAFDGGSWMHSSILARDQAPRPCRQLLPSARLRERTGGVSQHRSRSRSATMPTRVARLRTAGMRSISGSVSVTRRTKKSYIAQRTLQIVGVSGNRTESPYSRRDLYGSDRIFLGRMVPDCLQRQANNQYTTTAISSEISPNKSRAIDRLCRPVDLGALRTRLRSSGVIALPQSSHSHHSSGPGAEGAAMFTPCMSRPVWRAAMATNLCLLTVERASESLARHRDVPHPNLPSPQNGHRVRIDGKHSSRRTILS